MTPVAVVGSQGSVGGNSSEMAVPAFKTLAFAVVPVPKPAWLEGLLLPQAVRKAIIKIGNADQRVVCFIITHSQGETLCRKVKEK